MTVTLPLLGSYVIQSIKPMNINLYEDTTVIVIVIDWITVELKSYYPIDCSVVGCSNHLLSGILVLSYHNLKDTDPNILILGGIGLLHCRIVQKRLA